MREVGETLAFLRQPEPPRGFKDAMEMLPIARSVLSAQRKRDLLSHRTIARVNRVLKQSPVWYGTLVRLATLPAAVKNYGLALLEIEFPTCEFFPLSCASRAND